MSDINPTVGASLDPEFVYALLLTVDRFAMHSQRVVSFRDVDLDAEADAAQEAADLTRLEILSALTSYRVSDGKPFPPGEPLRVTAKQMLALVHASVRWHRDLVRELRAVVYPDAECVDGVLDGGAIFFQAGGITIGIERGGYTHS